MPETPLGRREAQLIKRICDGDPEPFRELVRPYERLVYVTAIPILRNEADAEEVAQEAVLKAFSKLPSFRGESKFSTRLVQITYNEARMRLKKDRRYLALLTSSRKGSDASGDRD
jgi:RNA polymerase sigma-70 factor, ECF subfamily